MRRATVLQMAALSVLVGIMLVMLGGGGVTRPTPVTSSRPATESEERQRDRERLHEELDRLWEKQQR